MKSQTNTSLTILTSVALALAMAIWTPVRAQTAEPANGTKTAEATMMERCQAMQEQKQKMNEDMKAQDAQLTEQLAKMNSAPADKKMDQMAAIITLMAEQRIAMAAKKAKMEQDMMQHMMQHMQMGKESMAQCPMMKGMKGMGPQSASDKPAASDADRAFLQAMVPHHEMAIEMAKMAQQKAKNPTIKSMADEIIRTQSDEIEKMKAIHQRLFGSELKSDMMAHDRLGLTTEESGMKMDMAMLKEAKNFDKMFAEQMTIHHQGGIKMARKVLETSTDDAIRKLAQAIIDAQTKEIKTLETIR